MNSSKITFKIDTEEPLSVEKFSNALLAFNEEYKKFADYNQELTISEVRKGSYEVDFLPIIVPSLFAAIENSNNTIEFIKHIKAVTNYLVGKKDEKAPDAKSIELVNNIYDPVINNYGNIYLISGNEKVVIDNKEAKIAKSNTPKLLKDIKRDVIDIDVKEDANVYKKKLFYWHQIRFDEKKPNVGNKGIIESIQKEAVNVIFEDDSSTTKKEMITSQDGIDWQERGYIADVEVLRKGGKIMKYKILHNYMIESVTSNDPELF